jgi:hypothetical protein
MLWGRFAPVVGQVLLRLLAVVGEASFLLSVVFVRSKLLVVIF